MRFLKNIITLSFLLSVSTHHTSAQELAISPPMGWNSYDCFGAAVLEREVKGNADVMAALLKKHGWEYIVVDYCWSYPVLTALNNPPQDRDYEPSLSMDEYGRLLPAPAKFPSAAGGVGFKELADYVHGRGLKFGIHVMRGIPREAVHQKLPIKGTRYTADQIAEKNDTCRWLNQMYGIDMSKPGAQAYYNSIFELYASWDVDYVKVDDILSPFHEEEIIGVRKAIENSGRPMVLSLSHGSRTPVEKAGVLKKHAHLWRISADFWDEWEDLEKMFALTHQWEKHIGPGHWPDADMIPFGRLCRRGPKGEERESRFTPVEKQTLMSLWSIAKSPLMYGGDLMQLRTYELPLLTNDEVLAVNQHSENNRQLFRRGTHVAWVADVPDSQDKYLGVFNIGEDEVAHVQVLPSELGLRDAVEVRDLWGRKDLGSQTGILIFEVPRHGSRLFRLKVN